MRKKCWGLCSNKILFMVHYINCSWVVEDLISLIILMYVPPLCALAHNKEITEASGIIQPMRDDLTL